MAQAPGPTRRLALVAGLLAVAVGGMLYVRGGASLPRPTRETRYNVLFLSLDTVRQDALGCYGRRPRHAPTLSPSPALDVLARDGVRMVDAYASSSWTLPSHMTMMTGLSPLVHAVETEGASLDPAIPTMADILRGHGYRTVGIYSAPYLDPHWGFARGFDDYRPAYGAELVAVARRAADIRADAERAAAADDWQRYDEIKQRQAGIDRELNDGSQTAVTSDEVTTAVLAEMEDLARGGKPWLLFAHFFDAHCDYVPPPPYDRRFDPDYRGTFTAAGCMGGPLVGWPDPNAPERLIRALGDRDLEHAVALYEGEVAWVDAHVGTIVRKLDELGLGGKTLVVVVADHGEEFFEHGGLGHRRTLQEEVVRVPFLLRLPGVLPTGAAIRGAVSTTALLPTVLDVVGLPAAASADGASLLPLIQGRDDAAPPPVLARTVIMFGGEVAVDAGERVPLRQVVVQDAFRRGPIKITRARRWPQFRAGLAPELNGVLQKEAAAQYEREQLRWIDVERFPDEPDDRQSTDFTDPAAHAALAAFRDEYAALLARRSAHSSKLPQNVRLQLESLGYMEPATSGPQFPEPDIVLPPPRGE